MHHHEEHQDVRHEEHRGDERPGGHQMPQTLGEWTAACPQMCPMHAAHNNFPASYCDKMCPMVGDCVFVQGRSFDDCGKDAFMRVQAMDSSSTMPATAAVKLASAVKLW